MTLRKLGVDRLLILIGIALTITGGVVDVVGLAIVGAVFCVTGACLIALKGEL